jgi:hypothetical protein
MMKMKDNKRIKREDAQVWDENEIKSEVENNLNSAISIFPKNNYLQKYKKVFRKNGAHQKEKNVVQVHEGAEIRKKREEKVLLVKLFFQKKVLGGEKRKNENKKQTFDCNRAVHAVVSFACDCCSPRRRNSGHLRQCKRRRYY